MTISRLTLFLTALLVASPVFAADPYATELSAAWRTRLAFLTTPQTVTAAFSESRTTPLKKRPVVVTGTVRIDRARGLSLTYDQKNSPVIILDGGGLLLRQANGREQSAPPEAETDLRLLHALFAFDLATLEKSYALAASDSPEGTWTLTFTRRPDDPATYRELALTGDATRLTTITLGKSASAKTVITVEPPRLDVPFTPDELARYFRKP